MKTVRWLMAIVVSCAVPVQSSFGECDAAAILSPSPYTNWASLSDGEKYEKFLIMLGSTPEAKITAKDVEKKDFELGINLTNDRSLLLKYEIQGQREPRKAWLQKVDLISATGRHMTLTKEPIDDQMQPLPIEIKGDPALTEEIRNVAFPVMVDAPLLEKIFRPSRRFMGPKYWVNFVDSRELRKYGGTNQVWLLTISHFRWFKQLITWQLGKQVINTALWAGLIVYMGSGIKSKSLIGSLMNHFNGTEQSQTQAKDKSGNASALTASIKSNQQITDADKVWLLGQLASAQPVFNGQTKLAPDDIELVPGIDPGRVWIRQKSTGKLFVGTLAVESQNNSADVRISSLVEIPSEQMSATFSAVTKLFTNHAEP